MIRSSVYEKAQKRKSKIGQSITEPVQEAGHRESERSEQPFEQEDSRKMDKTDSKPKSKLILLEFRT